MTTPEHILVGIHTGIALSWQRAHGWPIIAFAGFASMLPDWDGLPVLVDVRLFDAGHRVWGHNLLIIACVSGIVAWSQWRYRWVEAGGNWAGKFLPANSPVQASASPPVPLWILIGAALIVQLIHLPCDMVVSGGAGLSDWPIQPFWPFAKSEFVFPLIAWGDVAPTIIMMAGAIGLAKFPDRATWVSRLTLGLLVAYMLTRGLLLAKL